MEEKDLYKIIGTSRQAVTTAINGEKRSEKEQDLFIKEKAEHTIKLLEIKKKFSMSSEEDIEEIKRKIEEVEYAYEKLKTIDLRNTYNTILDSRREQKKSRLPIQRDAYKILWTSREVCSNFGKKDVDNMLLQQKERLIQFAQKGISDANFSKKQIIELEIKEIEEAYDKIKDKESREKYNEMLDKMREKRIKKMQEEEAKEKYDCSMKYDESLLYSKETPHLVRFMKNVIFHKFKAQKGKIIEIAETGKIDYTNFSSVFKSSISEYLIRRIINGEERQDYIYGNLSIIDLSIDKHTGNPINPEYYDLIVNKVLSEESIESCVKYNHGYIGEIQKNKQGYERNFDNAEQISAVMKVYGEKDMKQMRANQELGG